jgi:allantoin racemase
VLESSIIMNLRIAVVNPNSSQYITDAIDRAVECYRSLGIHLQCFTLKEGPPGINSDLDAANAVAPMARLADNELKGFDAIIIACFADPGLSALRQSSRKVVVGIAESSFYAAMNRVDRFGILTSTSVSSNRLFKYSRSLSISQRLAACEPVGKPVSELAVDSDDTLKRMIAALGRLENAGAEAIILGCSGMAPFYASLQEHTELPIIEPHLSAVGAAITALMR